jgi:rieske iron-sulfur protein
VTVFERSKRRDLLRVALGLGAALPALKVATAADDAAAKARPQAGDQFVFFSGDKKGQVVKPDDLPIGGPQVLTYPMDPQTKTVRKGSRLNQVLLIRLDPGQLSEDARVNAAEDGVLAFSATCTHQGCPVSMWKKDQGVFYCACHGSEFDPKEAAKVVAGPAPKRLAMLPVKIDGGQLVAAGPFTGQVGPTKR